MKSKQHLKCIEIKVNFEFCIECNKDTPFAFGFKCMYCGCDSPFGEFYDLSVSDSQIETYEQLSEVVGRIDQ